MSLGQVGRVTLLARARDCAGRPVFGGLFSMALVTPLFVCLRGFTVDDALIPARVAVHLRAGLGARFNVHGPIVDAVTPLGFAELLALLGGRQVIDTFYRAKWLGALSALLAAFVLGTHISRCGQRLIRFAPLVLLSVSSPLAAWAVSGMETGIVVLFAALALSSGLAGTFAAGVAAALRPELVPWAIAVGASRAFVGRASPARSFLHVLVAFGPALVVALTRLSLFGRVVPLAFFAKPSDFSHGLRYALGGLAFSGLPWLLLRGRPLVTLDANARGLVAAFIVHVLSLILAGGDWMPYYRLWVPVLPSLALLGACLAERASRPGTVVRLGLGLVATSILGFGLGPSARRVGAERLALIEAARPALRGAERVAAVDVGWVGAATEADIVDLAGVTDPEVALLAGGHTSKRIPEHWLDARRVDRVILLLAPRTAVNRPWFDSVFSRTIDARVAWLARDTFTLSQTLELGSAQTYLVLARSPGTSAELRTTGSLVGVRERE